MWQVSINLAEMTSISFFNNTLAQFYTEYSFSAMVTGSMYCKYPTVKMRLEYKRLSSRDGDILSFFGYQSMIVW